MTLNSKLSWVAGITIALLAVCFASTTQAGTQMYSGSLIIHAFANDTTTNTATPPYGTNRIVGIPLVGQCNTKPYHPQETITKYLPPAISTYTVTFTIPAYGGQGTDTNGDTLPDTITGCGTSTIEDGNPMYGSGPVDTVGVTGVSCNSPGPCTNPRQISMPRWALRRHLNGTASFEAYGVYLWEVHFADLHNDTGVFAKNGGDGAFAFGHSLTTGDAQRSITQTAGANQFGGVMRLLGSYGDNEGYLYNNITTSVFYFNWLFHYLGIGGQALGATPPHGRNITYINYGYTRATGYPTTSTVYMELFKWTTGTVTVTAKGGTFPTIIHRSGYDKRTASGKGVVQLVAPMLTKWVGAGTSATAGIGIMKLEFTPEPSEWMLLASGVSMLGLMGWRRSRRP